MKSFPSKKEILAQDRNGTPYYAFVRTKRNCVALAEVFPGQGYALIFEIEITHPKTAHFLFFDLYQQLKGVFENISRHH